MDSPFEAQLRSNSADLEANLVYADFLEDRGDPAADIYRWIGRGAQWWTGRHRGGAIDALRSGHETEFVLLMGWDEVARIPAEMLLFRFALWCARTVVDDCERKSAAGNVVDQDEQVHPSLLAILEENESWLAGDRSEMSEVPTSTLGSVGGWVNRVCRMAGYGVALSAAKYTSRFAEQSKISVLSFHSQTFELTRMLAQSRR